MPQSQSLSRIPFRVCGRSAAVVASGFILADPDDGWHSSAGTYISPKSFLLDFVTSLLNTAMGIIWRSYIIYVSLFVIFLSLHTLQILFMSCALILWLCGLTCVTQNVVFSSGRTALQMSRDLSIQLPRPDQNVSRSRSKTYPKRIAQTQPAGKSQNPQLISYLAFPLRLLVQHILKWWL